MLKHKRFSQYEYKNNKIHFSKTVFGSKKKRFPIENLCPKEFWFQKKFVSKNYSKKGWLEKLTRRKFCPKQCLDPTKFFWCQKFCQENKVLGNQYFNSNIFWVKLGIHKKIWVPKNFCTKSLLTNKTFCSK